jgi:lipopolysaccharide export system protein LptC
MSLDLIIIALAVLAGVGYFTVRNNRKQAEIKRRAQ